METVGKRKNLFFKTRGIAPTRVCAKCSVIHPTSTDFFHKAGKDRQGNYKLNSWCKLCRNAINRSRPSIVAKNHQYYVANKQQIIKQHRAYRHSSAFNQSPKRRFGYYKANAKKHGYEFALSFTDFMVFWQKPCIYCGDSIPTIGLDRINNQIGYISSNITACCAICNYMKRGSSVKDFINQCRIISSRGVEYHGMD